MRKRLLVSLFMALTLLAVSNIREAKAQGATASEPNLSGVWGLKSGPALPGTRGGITIFNIRTRALLQPWAEEKCKVLGCGQGVNVAGVPTGREYDETADPVISRCAAEGFPRALLGGPFEIIQIPGRVLMLWEHRDSLRQIWMDGRKHPEDAYLWMGHSTGRWDGDTLVVDTVGLNDHTWLDDAGHPHSDALHVVERIRRTNPSTLQIGLLFEDPKTFTEPFRGRLEYQLRPGAHLEENILCEDRILSTDPEDVFPFFRGEYPEPKAPPFVPKN